MDKIMNLSIEEGRKHAPLIEIMTEDGPGIYPAWMGYHLSAVDEDGRVFLHYHEFQDADEVQNFYHKVQAHLEEEGELNPNHWNFHRFVYGSSGWLREVQPRLVEGDKNG